MSDTKKVYKSLDELGGLIPENDKIQIKEKEEYQEKWRDNKYKFRMMISQKNRKWLIAEAQQSEFKYYKEFSDIYEKIENMFAQEGKRKWLLHIITNFLPLNKARQVPRLPVNKHICPIGGYELTDVSSIMTGDRDKHIAFTGEKTNVILSGIALQEIERFVMNHTHDFDTQAGHIINYAIDQLRMKSQKTKTKSK